MDSFYSIRPVKMLSVEDGPGDIELTRESLNEQKILINLNVVQDGVVAMQYLRQEGEFSNAKIPDLIILDLNLPKKDGREVLHDIKLDDSLKLIPIVILTTSDADEDIVKTYELGENCYITKPIGLTEFKKIISSIKDFGFQS